MDEIFLLISLHTQRKTSAGSLCKCVIVCIKYGVLRVIFMMSLMYLITFIFAVFMSILSNKVCSLSSCTVEFYVAWCKILHLHLLHIGAAESLCKDLASTKTYIVVYNVLHFHTFQTRNEIFLCAKTYCFQFFKLT